MKNYLNPIKIILLIFLSIIVNSCTDIDDNLNVNKTVVDTQNIVKKDSELLQLIDKVVSKSSNSFNEIVCLDFIYPFKLLIYDNNFAVIGEKNLVGDNDFSAFLGGLNPNQNISISYPIRTTLLDGTIFSVNNNTELKLALESCTKEDIIAYGSGIFGGNGVTKCVWKVPYKLNFNNKYTSGVFESRNDGTLKFLFDNQTYIGTWTFLFVNDEFQININLEGTTQVAQDWNISRKIIFDANATGSIMRIIDLPKDVLLEQAFEVTKKYAIGQNGPTNGIVFYDKGFYSFGWRYLEAAPNDLLFFEWGCAGTSILNTSENIGLGMSNAAKIANFHDGILNYYTNPAVCNASNNGSVVAREALLYENNDFIDWYLPSEKELELVYLNLKLSNLGNFTNNSYWTSTQVDADFVKTINFGNGTINNSTKIPLPNNIKARPIRSF